MSCFHSIKIDKQNIKVYRNSSSNKIDCYEILMRRHDSLTFRKYLITLMGLIEIVLGYYGDYDTKPFNIIDAKIIYHSL